MGLAMGGTTCPAADGISCTELDDDWPDMGLACPQAHHNIPRHTLAIMSATILQLGHYKSVPRDQFPVDECYTTAPNSTVSSYGFLSQGSFDMWFFAHDKCDCKPDQPLICHDRASEAEKCNLRTFTMCKVTKKTETCIPKHHPGWKPIGEKKIEGEGHKEEEGGDQSSSTSSSFDPTHRQQTLFFFNDTQTPLTGFWWSIAELLGFYGAV